MKNSRSRKSFFAFLSSKGNKTIRIIVFFFIALGIISYSFFVSLFAPLDSSSTEEKVIVIKTGSTITSIGNTLASEDIIKSPLAFKIAVYKYNLTNSIQAGSFRLSPADSVKDIAYALTKGRLDVWLTIPEGLRNEEIANIVSEVFSIPQDDFLTAASGLQGKLFPETYLIPDGASSENIVNVLHDTYLQETALLKQGFNKSNLSEDEVVNLAAIIERETLSDEEKPIVAGILLKRLENDWPLQTDATLQYIVGDEQDWWPIPTALDKEISSPYNTYENLGLPPTPIANPGITSIEAVLNPVASDYWFYIHDSSGNIHYAADSAGHAANIEKYLR